MLTPESLVLGFRQEVSLISSFVLNVLLFTVSVKVDLIWVS